MRVAGVRGSGVRAGDGEDQPAATAGIALDPDGAAVTLHDLLHDRKADAGARVDVAGVQSFQPAEHPLPVFEGDPDAVVGDGEPPPAVVGRGRECRGR